jgi:hypothetical protein
VYVVKGELKKSLLEREMSRKEFLQVAGGSLVGVLGLTNFAELLINVNKPAQKPQAPQKERYAFGNRRFGV